MKQRLQHGYYRLHKPPTTNPTTNTTTTGHLWLSQPLPAAIYLNSFLILFPVLSKQPGLSRFCCHEAFGGDSWAYSWAISRPLPCLFEYPPLVNQSPPLSTYLHHDAVQPQCLCELVQGCWFPPQLLRWNSKFPTLYGAIQRAWR